MTPTVPRWAISAATAPTMPEAGSVKSQPRPMRPTARQRTLFDERDFERLERLDRAVDSIREKYGEGALCRACFLHGDVAPMGGGLSKERRTGITKPV